MHGVVVDGEDGLALLPLHKVGVAAQDGMDRVEVRLLLADDGCGAHEEGAEVSEARGGASARARDRRDGPRLVDSLYGSDLRVKIAFE